MRPPKRTIVAAISLSLSACASVPLPQRGLYFNATGAFDSLRLTIPCPTPYACSVSPQLQVLRRNAFGFEVGAGYRFSRFLSAEANSMLYVDGEGADMRPPPQDNPTASLRPKTFIRVALRGDLPIARFLSVYGTYGVQLEDLIASTAIETGKIINTTFTTTCPQPPPGEYSDCEPTTITQPEKEVGYNTNHHRDMRASATVGVDLWAWGDKSLHVEYLPRNNGHVGAITVGASWYW